MRIFKGKSRRTVIFGAVTVASIVILLALNLLLSYVGQQNTVYIDMSPEGLYSLSDRMVEECAFIDELGETDGDKAVKITFCTDPDYLEQTYVTRATYYMALKMRQTYDNVEVETVNVTYNPTALSAYKTTSLTEINPTDVIVSYGDRYRIVSALNFWSTATSSTSSTGYFGYNGEYRLATLIKSVTAIDQPSAYFVTDHGEAYYDANNPESEMSISLADFYDLLRDRGLDVKTLELSKVDAIPDDCALLIINNPKDDFASDPDRYDELGYVSDLEKIDRYLVTRQGAVMVARDYDETRRNPLPRLDDFLHEWGFDFSNSVVKDTESSTADSDGMDIIAVYETEENSYANAIYGEFASLGTAPQTVVGNTGFITNSYGEAGYKNEAGSMQTMLRYAPFLKTTAGASAYKYSDATGNYVDSSVLDATGQLDLMALTVRAAFNTETNEYTHSYLFCSASADIFTSDYLGDVSYANADVISALINNISRIDEYASIDLGGTSLNSPTYGGKQLVSDIMTETDTEVYSSDATEVIKVNYGLTTGPKVTYTVIVALVPFAFLVAGVIVCLKRKFL